MGVQLGKVAATEQTVTDAVLPCGRNSCDVMICPGSYNMVVKTGDITVGLVDAVPGQLRYHHHIVMFVKGAYKFEVDCTRTRLQEPKSNQLCCHNYFCFLCCFS